MLEHTPFFDRLESHSEGSDQWKSTLAGLLVLRLVDGWLDGTLCRTRDATGIASVREALSNMTGSDTTGPLLADIVRRMKQAELPRLAVLSGALRSYAAALEGVREWGLARDIMETVFRHARTAGDLPTAIGAGIDAARIARWGGQIDVADEILPTVEACVEKASDDIGRLRCNLVRINSLLYHGRLKTAADHFERLAPRIAAADDDYVYVCAASAQLEIGWRTRPTEGALAWGYGSLERTTVRRFHEGTLNGIAACHMVAKRYDAARTILEALVRDSSIDETVSVAMGNLIEIAFLQSDRVTFDRYQREIRPEFILPYERSRYHYIVGLAQHRFGRPCQATAEVREATRLAREYQVASIQRRAKRTLKAWRVK